MKLRNVVLALAVLKIVTCRNTPSISYITEDQIKRIGSSVEFQCSIQHASDFTAVWVRKYSEGGVIDIAWPYGSLIVQNSRFALRHDKSSSTYIFRINNIQESDAGTYECQIYIEFDNLITAEVELRVLRPPIISDNSTSFIFAKEGQSVQLECYADGYPSPNISWARENNVLLPTGESIHYGNTFKIESIEKEDRGSYYCVAENEIGQKSKFIQVHVKFAPKITAVHSRVEQVLQNATELKCYTEANPRPLMSWIKDNVQLSSNEYYSISNSLYNTTLRVNTVERKHYGYYICKASNELGSTETKIELFETSKIIATDKRKNIDEKFEELVKKFRELSHDNK